MARSPSGLPAFARGPTSKTADQRGTDGLRGLNARGNPHDYRPIAIPDWVAEGLTPTNAQAYDDVVWALAGCRGLAPDRQDAVADLVMGWALAAQGRGAA